MRRLILSLAAVLVLAGCANRQPPPRAIAPTVSSAPARDWRITESDLKMSRMQRKMLQDRLGVTRSPDEGASIREELARLDARIDELEGELAGRPAVDSTATTPPSVGTGSGYYGSSPVYTGPRGGRYTITPSGKKSYIKRK